MQLIRAGELAVTQRPVAHVWFLPGVCTQVSFEMRRFSVHLPTARVVANVSAPFWSFPSFLYLDAVGADTVGSLGCLASVGRSEHKRYLPIERDHLALWARARRGADADLSVESQQALEISQVEGDRYALDLGTAGGTFLRFD